MKNEFDGEKIPMTAAETAFIEKFTRNYCRPHAEVMRERLAAFVAQRRRRIFEDSGRGGYALAAGPAEVLPSSVKAPEEEVNFVFASEEDIAGAWRAEVKIPSGATVDTQLSIKVEQGKGGKAEGIFKVAGCALPLTDGKAEMPFGMFLAGIKDTEVDLNGVEGRLKFF